MSDCQDLVDKSSILFGAVLGLAVVVICLLAALWSVTRDR